MKQTKITRYYVECEVDSNQFIFDEDRRIEDHRRNAEELVKQIKRHTDALSAVVLREEEQVCSFCGDLWTEDSPDYNGGCCDQDEANNPEGAA